MAVQVEFLKSTPYFSGLSPEELESVRRSVFEKTAQRAEIVQHEGEPASVLYFVVSGAVKIFKTSVDGKEQILDLIRSGGSFNDVPVFSGGISLASVQAMGPAVLYGLKKDDLKTILRDHPQVALNIIQVLSQRVQHLVSLVEDLSFRHVTSRVAKILLEHASAGATDSPRLTQQEMAAMAGTVREMVGRSLKALEEEGAIKFERNRIIITNKQALEELAGVNT